MQRAGMLAAAGDLPAAEAQVRDLLRLRPDHPAALGMVSGLLQARGAFDEALDLADAALKTRPGCGEAWLVKGDAMLGQGRLDDALHAYLRAARIKATAFDANIRLGIAQGHMGRTPPALKAFNEAQALDPSSPVPKYQRGLLRLKMGDYAQAWDGYEARWDIASYVQDSRAQVPRALVPRLMRGPTREALSGQRVMLLGDQGVGDQVMFASMLPDVIAIAASVIVVCEPRLVKLFAASFPNAAFTSPAQAVIKEEEIDVILALGSLGGAFRRAPTDFPGSAYLAPSPEAAARWSRRLGAKTAKTRIGLSWRGGVHQTRRSIRSISLEQLAPILTLPDCEFVSLQYGDVADEVGRANVALGVDIKTYPDDDLRDFDDIAAAVQEMDVILTVQTALAHVSGAVGKRCLTMIPNIAEWRYGTSGERMSWYDSLRLLRQKKAGDWAPVIAAARQALVAEA